MITKSRWKSVATLLACGVLAATGAVVWASPGEHMPWLARVGIVMFALGGLYCAWEVVTPDRLIISRDSLQWITPWKTKTYTWDEISDFRVISIQGARMIGFNHIGGRAPRSLLAQLNKGMTGSTGALPGLWELPPGEVADVLNRARLEWASKTEVR